MTRQTPLLSVVVPCYNEQDNIEPLSRAVAQALSGLDYELIFVDDRSTDATFDRLRALNSADPRVRFLRFAENCGQSAATDAGIRAAAGEFVALLDGDLQNPPSEIPPLLERVRAGECDVACGSRVSARRDTWLRRVSSRVANRVRGRLLGDGISDSGCSLRVFRRVCFDPIKVYRGLHRFLPALFVIEGFRVREYPVRHFPRHTGVSKYGLWNRLVKVLPDLLAVLWMKNRSLRYRIAERS